MSPCTTWCRSSHRPSLRYAMPCPSCAARWPWARPRTRSTCSNKHGSKPPWRPKHEHDHSRRLAGRAHYCLDRPGPARHERRRGRDRAASMRACMRCRIHRAMRRLQQRATCWPSASGKSAPKAGRRRRTTNTPLAIWRAPRSLLRQPGARPLPGKLELAVGRQVVEAFDVSPQSGKGRALILAEIERLDRATIAAQRQGEE